VKDILDMLAEASSRAEILRDYSYLEDDDTVPHRTQMQESMSPVADLAGDAS